MNTTAIEPPATLPIDQKQKQEQKQLHRNWFFWNILHDSAQLDFSSNYYWQQFMVVVEELKANSTCSCSQSAMLLLMTMLNMDVYAPMSDPTEAIKEAQKRFMLIKDHALFFSIFHDEVNIKLGKRVRLAQFANNHNKQVKFNVLAELHDDVKNNTTAVPINEQSTI